MIIFILLPSQVPQKLKENNYKGVVKLLFEVNAEGEFKVIYVSVFYLYSNVISLSDVFDTLKYSIPPL